MHWERRSLLHEQILAAMAWRVANRLKKRKPGMSIELAERLKEKLTNRWVVVDPSVPELSRFAKLTGQVKTVNMNCRALVQFDGPADIAWYDIDPAYLTVVDGPRPKPAPAAKASAAASKTAAAKTEPVPAAPSPSAPAPTAGATTANTPQGTMPTPATAASPGTTGSTATE